MQELNVQVLVVGGGGCGLTASIFLSGLGVDHLVVERHPGTSPVPKAHGINPRTMEILRAYDVADSIYQKGTPLENYSVVRWITSLGGNGPLDAREIHSLAKYDPKYVEQLVRNSPCLPTNLPQLRLEPILRNIAEMRAPGRVRFNHELVDFEDGDNGVRATIRDRVTGESYRVRARYVIAADGGRTIGPRAWRQDAWPAERVSSDRRPLQSRSVTIPQG